MDTFVFWVSQHLWSGSHARARKDVVWASHEADGLDQQAVGYRHCSPPQLGFVEQVWEHDMAADSQGAVPVAVVNDQLGFGILIETCKDQLPCAFQWQNFQAGHYVMGIEPSTHHIKGNLFARGRGEIIWLQAGEAPDYTTRFEVLIDAASIAAAETKISSIACQPDQEYPKSSGNFAALYSSGHKAV